MIRNKYLLTGAEGRSEHVVITRTPFYVGDDYVLTFVELKLPQRQQSTFFVPEFVSGVVVELAV